MRNLVNSIFAAAALVVGGAAFAGLSDLPSGNYGLDTKHGYITFTYSHGGYSNPHVGYDNFDVRLTLDSDDIENSSVEVTIDAASINSRVEVFDGHLRGEDYFDTEKYPTITFISTSFDATGEDTYDVSGDLTIKGNTHPVVLETTVNKAEYHSRYNTPHIGVSGMTKVSRTAFGLPRGTPIVGDEVTIYIEVELPKAED